MRRDILLDYQRSAEAGASQRHIPGIAQGLATATMEECHTPRLVRKASQTGVLHPFLTVPDTLESVDGRSLLHLALAAPAVEDEVLARLIAAGADPNGHDAFGHTPLCVAVTNRRSIGVVRLLLENGASADEQNEETSELGDTGVLGGLAATVTPSLVDIAIALGSVVVAHELMMRGGKSNGLNAVALAKETYCCDGSFSDQRTASLGTFLLQSFTPGFVSPSDNPTESLETGSEQTSAPRTLPMVASPPGCSFVPGRWITRLPRESDLDSGCGDGSEFFYVLRVESSNRIRGFQTREDFDESKPLCSVDGTVDGSTVSWKCTPLVPGLHTVAHCVSELGDDGATMTGEFDIRDPATNEVHIEGVFSGETVNPERDQTSIQTEGSGAERKANLPAAIVKKSTPSLRSSHLTVTKGEVLTLLGGFGAWRRVRNSGGEEGLVHINCLELLQESPITSLSTVEGQSLLPEFLCFRPGADEETMSRSAEVLSDIEDKMWDIPVVPHGLSGTVRAGSQLVHATRFLGVSVAVPTPYLQLITPVIEVAIACVLHAIRKSNACGQLRREVLLVRVSSTPLEALQIDESQRWNFMRRIVRANARGVIQSSSMRLSMSGIPVLEDVSSRCVHPGDALTDFLCRLSTDPSMQQTTVVIACCDPSKLDDTVQRVGAIERAFLGIVDQRLLASCCGVGRDGSETRNWPTARASVALAMNRIGWQSKLTLHGSRGESSNWGMCVLDMKSYGSLWTGSPAVVEHVSEGSCAHAMGLRRGDEVVKVNDVSIDKQDTMVRIVGASTRLKISIVRHGPTILNTLTEKLDKQKASLTFGISNWPLQLTQFSDRLKSDKSLPLT